MTKYEFERELRQNISRLPEPEILRVISYYNELFADKADEGLTEMQIIAAFGNPFDAATRILSEYDAGEEKREKTKEKRTDDLIIVPAMPAPVSPPPQREAKEKKGNSAAVAMRILFLIPFFVVAIVIWSVVVSLAASSVGLIAGGAAYMGYGFYAMSLLFGAGLATAGGGAACVGLGLLLLAVVPKLFKLTAKMTKRYFVSGGKK